MWFKNLITYQFQQPFNLTAEQLEEKLNEKPFQPCHKDDMSSYGFVPALGPKTKALVHAAQGCLLICARHEEKILPNSVINDELQEKIDQIEEEQDRQVFAKESKALRDDVIQELLPKAFRKSKYTQAYIDTQAGWLVVNATSAKQAEELTTHLRFILGSLPITNPVVSHLPSFYMTKWLSFGQPPENFALGWDCKLRGPESDSGKITASNEDLTSEAIEKHLDEGKEVSRLSLWWKGAISCVFCEDLSIKRLKFSDEIKEKALESNAETKAEQMDADFVLMTSTLRTFLNQLFKALN